MNLHLTTVHYDTVERYGINRVEFIIGRPLTLLTIVIIQVSIHAYNSLENEWR